MSANANGTPTSLGIPTLNPAQDDAGPLGINEITQAIDARIAARMFAPAAPTDKQVVKWNNAGGAWVASFVAPSELAQEGATDKQALVWSSASGKWVPGNMVGQEVAFAEITAPVSGITATTEATATAILTAPSFTADGVLAYEVDFYVPRSTNTASQLVSYALYDNGASIGILAETQFADSGGHAGEHSGRRRLVPTAGAHIYSIRVFGTSASYTATAGPGGSAQYVPAFIRVRKAT